ncbi:MAG: YlmC/YmxH family sporulation protein [Clostridiales bacterium]
MIKISELQEKEIINCADGRYMGSMRDIEIDLETGKIRSIILPNPGSVGFFKKKEQSSVSWHEIRKIGFDVILIESFGQNIPQYLLNEKNL